MCASTAQETLRPIPWKFGKVTVATHECLWNKALSFKMNQFILMKHSVKLSSCPDKIHMFSYLFQIYFQVFWKANSTVHVDEEHKG